MLAELVFIPTPTTPLDGALSGRGRAARLRAAVPWQSHELPVGRTRFLPPVLATLGYASLAFNRHGHDILSIRDSRQAEGGAFQLTREAIEDNRLHGRLARRRGCRRH
jgi:hypothetical protein